MDADTHGRRLDGSLLHVGPLLTLQAGRQLLVGAVRHLFDQVQTLLHLEPPHTHQKKPRHTSITITFTVN